METLESIYIYTKGTSPGLSPFNAFRSGSSLLWALNRSGKEAQSTKDGFLPQDKILDFLRKVSRADVADGAAGRLWKAQMVMTPGPIGFKRSKGRHRPMTYE